MKSPILLEDEDSWKSFVERRTTREDIDTEITTVDTRGETKEANLHREHKNEYGNKHDYEYENKHEFNDVDYIGHYVHRGLKTKSEKKAEKRRKKLEKLLQDPGIRVDSMHGLMIDAGSTGSRMHVYEFNKRVLEGEKEISEAVSGKKLSYPGTDSRWTERLRPGLATFSMKSDEDIIPAITEYLYPLIEFAETVLHTKHNQWSQFPIYLKATAGMRLLEPQQRVRVIDAVRHILGNSTYSSFKFETEYARVISGEEEAIYGWAGTNFVLGSLLQNSQGSGTVKNPKLTHGALEMGGASAQISFYQDNEDIMSNLFKLQIGQGKHWNVYAHSHLCFGMNEAWNRMGALLAFSSTSTGNSNNDVPSKIYNPCLAGGSSVEFESSVEYEHASVAWRVDGTGNALPYTTMMTNPNTAGDYDACTEIAHTILNKQYNAWCNFSHHGDCSFSGVYQPQLPVQSQNFGEFLAFSNYYHIWDFLKMPLRSSLSTLQDSTRKICAMNVTELDKWNGGRFEEPDASLICFRASYAFQVLHNGYGFKLNDNITATNVVNGQKIGWALGSMLYEINTLPWEYIPRNEVSEYNQIEGNRNVFYSFLLAVLICVCFGFFLILRSNRRRIEKKYYYTKRQYSSIGNVELEQQTN